MWHPGVSVQAYVGQVWTVSEEDKPFFFIYFACCFCFCRETLEISFILICTHKKTQNSGFFLLGFFYLFFSILRQLKSTSERVLHYQHLRTGKCFNICFSSLLLTQYWDQSSKITSATDKFDNYFGSCGLLPQNSKDKSKRFLLCL